MPENEQTCEDSRRRASVNGSAKALKKQFASMHLIVRRFKTLDKWNRWWVIQRLTSDDEGFKKMEAPEA